MIATSCVIVDDDDDDGDGLGDAGETSSGGRTVTGGRPGTGGATGGRGGSGGTSTGGTATGGTSTGGTTPQGGAGGEPGEDACLVDSTPIGSCNFQGAEDDSCAECLADSCCDEVSACYGTDPEDVCGYPAGEGEFECARECLGVIANAGEFPTDDDVDDCIAQCMKCGLPTPNTGPLVVCMNDNCSDDCY
jgi:hypothetical protein